MKCQSKLASQQIGCFDGNAEIELSLRERGREGSSNRFKMNGRESKSKIWKHLKRKKWSELKSWERVRDRETELVRTSVIEWEIKTEREWVRDRETELLRTSVIEWEIKTEREWVRKWIRVGVYILENGCTCITPKKYPAPTGTFYVPLSIRLV